MTIAYIAHPISGDVVGNLKRIATIIRRINLSEPDVVPLAPYFSDLAALDDGVPEERDRGLKNDLELLRLCDELRVYGDHISSGMNAEMKIASDMGIPIRHFPYL